MVKTRTILTLALGSVLAGQLLAGCSSTNDETVTDPYTGGPGLEAPAASTANYPPGPYGTRVGSVIADASFFGYTSFDKNARTLVPISFHDYYDPDGTRGAKLIYFSAGAIWCPPCNTEAGDLADPTGAAALSQKYGIQFLSNLVQGARQDSAFPATEQDLNTWLNKYKLPFAVFLDPAHKLDIYFDATGIPFGMLIDPRTMKIVKTTDGWFGSDTSLPTAEQRKQRLQAFEDELTPFLAK